MPGGKIHITESDMARLRQMTEARYVAHAAQMESLSRLEDELDRAEVVESSDIPGDVVTMNSCVRVSDLDSGREHVYRIVFPAQSWGKPGTLSVLSPLGTALLGYRVGDTLEARTPGGMRNLKVLELMEQPEGLLRDPVREERERAARAAG